MKRSPQVTALSQTQLRSLPPGITPPNILRYNASTVPILRLALSSASLTEQELFDFGNNFLKTQLATVPGASAPLPYGGKQRQIMVDIDSRKLQERNLSPMDVVNAVTAQNLILPSGTAKIGSTEYSVEMNGSPDSLAGLNNIPIKIHRQRHHLYSRRRARARRLPAANQHRARERPARGAADHQQKRQHVHARNRRPHQEDDADAAQSRARVAEYRSRRRSVAVRARFGAGRAARSADRRVPDRSDDSAVSRQLARDADHRRVDSAVDDHVDHRAVAARRNHQHHDARRARARGRHSGRRRDGGDRKHQPSTRAGQDARAGDSRRRASDCDSDAGVDLVDLHRVRADVSADGRRALSVHPARRSGGVRDAGVLLLLAYARADAREIPAALSPQAGGPASRAGANAQSVHARALRVRTRLRAFARALSRVSRSARRAAGPVRDAVSGLLWRVDAADAVSRPRLFPGRRRRHDRAASARENRHAGRGNRGRDRSRRYADSSVDPAGRAAFDHRQHRLAGLGHQPLVQQHRHDRHLGCGRADHAQSRSPSERRLRAHAAAHAHRRIPRRAVRVPARGYRQPNAQLRHAVADRHSDRRARRGRQSRVRRAAC